MSADQAGADLDAAEVDGDQAVTEVGHADVSDGLPVDVDDSHERGRGF